MATSNGILESLRRELFDLDREWDRAERNADYDEMAEITVRINALEIRIEAEELRREYA